MQRLRHWKGCCTPVVPTQYEISTSRDNSSRELNRSVDTCFLVWAVVKLRKQMYSSRERNKMLAMV